MKPLNIFISYRRSDPGATDLANRLYKTLSKRFGKGRVFLDEDAIPAATDFRVQLASAVSKADIVLAVIGPDWLELLNQRAEEENDFVRIELETALEQHIRIVPLLVDDVQMPKEHELPESIGQLSYRHAFRVHTGKQFRADAKALNNHLGFHFGGEKESQRKKQANRRFVLKTLAFGMGTAGLLGLYALIRTNPQAVEGEAGELYSVSMDPDPMYFRWCPPGKFLMGSPPEEASRDTDEQQREVRITQGFWMGQFEVTQEQYARFVENHRSEFQDNTGRLPVESVSWEEALQFALAMNDQFGAQLPKGYVFALPTEAQWEYACRAGTTTAVAFGNVLESHQANFRGTQPYGVNRAQKDAPSVNQTATVGSYEPNAWGLYDMHGNVWEWCRDYYIADQPDRPATDPAGPVEGSQKVIRGGGWSQAGVRCRSASRMAQEPFAHRSSLIGFRLAIVPKKSLR